MEMDTTLASHFMENTLIQDLVFFKDILVTNPQKVNYERIQVVFYYEFFFKL